MTLLICAVVILFYLLLLQAGRIHHLMCQIDKERARARNAEQFAEDALDIITAQAAEAQQARVWTGADVAWVRDLMKEDDR